MRDSSTFFYALLTSFAILIAVVAVGRWTRKPDCPVCPDKRPAPACPDCPDCPKDCCPCCPDRK